MPANHVIAVRSVYHYRYRFILEYMGEFIMAAFYTTKEAADKLGISVYTLRKYLQLGWLRAGRLPGGTVYRFSQRQLDEAMTCFEEGTVGVCPNES